MEKDLRYVELFELYQGLLTEKQRETFSSHYCYDFGDSIRFGCNPAVEDEKDLSKVNLSLELFEAYAKGYLGALKNSVTKIEKDNLAFGAILMTYECGMRFLADYLDGDVYFRRKREGQNLDRARTQFKLVEDMEKLLPKMQEIINKY